ncbi:hypothetical protein V5799_011388 [Amblyomma americanum]|uniref:Uncharacterized protein n=1 Tax=Amblyomma americanum TaxID=6943 RepID=A0AAQ4EH14_AMBAM
MRGKASGCYLPRASWRLLYCNKRLQRPLVIAARCSGDGRRKRGGSFLLKSAITPFIQGVMQAARKPRSRPQR